MIQRKQSVFLLISALLTGVLIISKYATFVAPEGTYILNMRGIWNQPASGTNVHEMGAYPLMILVLLTTLISLITIFLYKKRMLQIRLCGMNMVLQAGLAGFIFYYGHTTSKVLEAVVSYEWCVVFPLIALVLTLLSFIAIGKDEALIKSLNRIR